MQNTKVSKVTYVNVRQGWEKETQFSSWLRENLDALNDALGFELTEAETEKSTENFSADLLAKDNRLGTVVIENQYGKSDHDHLGKVITYLTSLNAQAAIWIVPEAREEHIRAVQYLNDETDQKFFLVRVSMIRVGDSPVAPVFTLLAGPDEQTKARRERGNALEATSKENYRFWEQFLAFVQDAQNKQGLRHQNCSPTTANWISGGTGLSGIGYNYVVNRNDSRVEVYCDRTEKEENKFVFDFLRSRKSQIEQRFGQALDWERLDDGKASRIRLDINLGFADESDWPELKIKLANAMRRLIAAVDPEIEDLKSALAKFSKSAA